MENRTSLSEKRTSKVWSMNKELFQKFVESLNLEDEEDYFLHERLMQFKKSENKDDN